MIGKILERKKRMRQVSSFLTREAVVIRLENSMTFIVF
jgi:hypothetical protein